MFKEIVVVDFTNNIAGPFCTQMFAYYGADVIKIEKVNTGDDSRGFAPMIDGESIGFRVHNRGKKSLAIDLKDEKNKELVKEIIRQADIVVESFRPGVMERLGLGYDEIEKLNKNIIMCSVSAFGNEGPYKELPGYDIIAQAMSGIMSVTGYPDGEPMKVGPSIADYLAGTNAFGAICAALYKREKTGEGDYIDISLLDCLISANDYYESAYIDGYKAFRNGNQHSLIGPYGVFTGDNGSVVIGALNDKLWYKLTDVIDDDELRDNSKFSKLTLRLENTNLFVKCIERWMNKFDNIEEPIRKLREANIPCAPVLNCWELNDNIHLQERGIASKLATPDLSVKETPARGMHLKFKNAKGQMGLAPKLGEHNDDIFKRFGIAQKS